MRYQTATCHLAAWFVLKKAVKKMLCNALRWSALERDLIFSFFADTAQGADDLQIKGR